MSMGVLKWSHVNLRDGEMVLERSPNSCYRDVAAVGVSGVQVFQLVFTPNGVRGSHNYQNRVTPPPQSVLVACSVLIAYNWSRL